MDSNIKNIKQEIKNFLLINFVLIAFISIFVFTSASKQNGSLLVQNFGGLFMYIPAFSVIVVLKKVSKVEFNPIVERFFRVFAITTIVRLVLSVLEAVVFNSIYLSPVIDIVVSLFIVWSIIYNTIYTREKLEEINLSLGKNIKKVLIVVLIFVVIIIIKIAMSIMINSDSIVNIEETIPLAIMSLISNFALAFNLFFGEEFGWRYFLQPRLQKIYGKKYGVLILGVIWGIWHLPLCFTLYSPQTPIYCVINHIAFCMILGVFLGYAYMKTENIWAPILIHLVNNSISIILSGSYESVITLETLIMSIVVNAILFLPFLLTKEYKSNTMDECNI
ncbi:MAG: lysostaphin resistance A-like protein [Cetobacterium sp.]